MAAARYFSILILSLIAFGSIAQNVVMERIIGRSVYYNNHRADSSSYSYPNKYLGNDYLATFYQLGEELRNIHFEKKFRYNADNEKIGEQIIEKGENSRWINVSNYSPEGKLLSREYVKYLPDTNLVEEQIIWNDMNNDGFLSKYFESYKTYNNDLRVIRDSMSTLIFDTLMSSSVEVYSYFNYIASNTKIKKSFDPYFPDIVYVQIDSSGEGFKTIENYTSENNTISNRTLKFWTFNSGRSQLDMELEYNLNHWDTVKFKEYDYIDSFDNNNNLVEQITYSRNSPRESFKQTQKFTRFYSQTNLLLEYKVYEPDSSSNWQLAITFSYEYDDSGKLKRFEVKNGSITNPSIIEFNYTKSGNLASEIHYNGGLSNGVYAYYYYYEPYLEKVVDLNYHLLKPISYPNPFTKSVNILFSCVPNKEGSINVYDMSGKIIEQHQFASPNEFYQYTWDSNGLSSGIYFAQIIMGKENETIKLMKQ